MNVEEKMAGWGMTGKSDSQTDWHFHLNCDNKNSFLEIRPIEWAWVELQLDQLGMAVFLKKVWRTLRALFFVVGQCDIFTYYLLEKIFGFAAVNK